MIKLNVISKGIKILKGINSERINSEWLRIIKHSV